MKSNMALIECKFPRIITSKEEVFEQVLSELKLINPSLRTNFKLSQIYFTSFDSRANLIYYLLMSKLIQHYHIKNYFRNSLVELL